jgi:hypothetical protein
MGWEREGGEGGGVEGGREQGKRDRRDTYKFCLVRALIRGADTGLSRTHCCLCLCVWRGSWGGVRVCGDIHQEKEEIGWRAARTRQPKTVVDQIII